MRVPATRYRIRIDARDALWLSPLTHGSRTPRMENAMAKQRKKRTNYTPQQRQQILAAAQKDGLTAGQVQKKFGVTPVTYYSWRKKTGVAGARGRRAAVAAAPAGDLTSQVRTQVQARVRELLPGIVRNEVNNYLNQLFASGRGRRTRT